MVKAKNSHRLSSLIKESQYAKSRNSLSPFNSGISHRSILKSQRSERKSSMGGDGSAVGRSRLF